MLLLYQNFYFMSNLFKQKRHLFFKMSFLFVRYKTLEFYIKNAGRPCRMFDESFDISL